MGLNWVEVNKPSIHGITRYRCGLYLLIEQTPGAWWAVKMSLWEGTKGVSEAEAREEAEMHLITQKLLGSAYRPKGAADGTDVNELLRDAASTAPSRIASAIWHLQNKLIVANPPEDTEDGDSTTGPS